jgi:DNA helicase-2/ATP-dependent DNA helicase PcrA
LWDLVYQRQLGAFSTRAAKALEGFRDLVVELQQAADELPLPSLLDRLLEATGYADLYDKEDPEAQNRRENLEEFLSAAQEFTEQRRAGALAAEEVDDLTAFLDHVSLVADIDTWQAGRGVSVMTLHSAKGLEFKAVFIGGLEDGLLPHFNAQGGREDLEEERRLLYVGMTRAEERLYLSSCRRRRIAGRYQDQMESPFVAEIPPHLLRVHESPSLFRAPRADGVYSFFGRRRPGDDRTFGEQVADALDGEGGPLSRGARVRHPSLGEGVILAFEGAGEQAKYTVFFDRAGKRKLLAKYASLERL